METTSQRIAELKAQLAKLEQKERKELQDRRAALVAELETIDRKLAGMDAEPATAAPTGKRRGRPPKAEKKRAGRPRKAKAGAHKDFADAQELSALLEKADGKRLNRKGFNDSGYSLKSAKTIAKTEPKVFGFKESGAQGFVWIK